MFAVLHATPSFAFDSNATGLVYANNTNSSRWTPLLKAIGGIYSGLTLELFGGETERALLFVQSMSAELTPVANKLRALGVFGPLSLEIGFIGLVNALTVATAAIEHKTGFSTQGGTLGVAFVNPALNLAITLLKENLVGWYVSLLCLYFTFFTLTHYFTLLVKLRVHQLSNSQTASGWSASASI